MKKRKKIWTILAVIIAIILLLYWLFAATMVEEDEGENYQTAPETTEITY